MLRELREETGLTEGSLTNLRLRYVTLRLKKGEIRQNYYFFANLAEGVEPADSNEGVLRWFPLSALDGVDMP